MMADGQWIKRSKKKIEKKHKKQRRYKHFRFVLVDCPLYRNADSMCIHSTLWLSFEFTHTNTHIRPTLYSFPPTQKCYPATEFRQIINVHTILLPLSSIGRFRFSFSHMKSSTTVFGIHFDTRNCIIYVCVCLNIIV